MTTLICELGVNHHGDFVKALRMIDKAKDAGADIVKFQYYDPIKVLGTSHPAFAYANQCFFTQKQHESLKLACDSAGIDYMVSVFDIKDVSWADGLCKAHKVATRMNNSHAFINKLLATRKPVYVSVQPETDLKQYVDNMQLMWCVAKYPSLKAEVLSYPYSKFLGLSSHCPDWTASYEAYIKGARVFENHVCESREEQGCDIPASLTFDEYTKFTKSIKDNYEYDPQFSGTNESID